MYCHPAQVNKWAKALKPAATPQQIEQARIMRAGKQKKAAFLDAQISLFPLGKKTAPDGSRNGSPSPSQHFLGV